MEIKEKYQIIHSDVMDGLKQLADKSVNCVISSPPYWQLRDYGFAGQWGLEPTFQEYLDNLWSMMDEIYRVLTDDGTVWINLGDTYGRGARSKDGDNHDFVSNQSLVIEPTGKPNYFGLDKCLLMIPQRFAIGCIERGWIVRNEIIWAKPNGMPESVTDRFSKKHEQIYFMVKNKKYYFDLDAVREKHKQISLDRINRKWDGHKEPGTSFANMDITRMCNPNGKNPGDTWTITTKGSSEKHYAMYNDNLIKRPILAGCPKGGVVLDMFMGTGTTGVTALHYDRKFIGIEAKKEYFDIANKNVETTILQQKLF